MTPVSSGRRLGTSYGLRTAIAVLSLGLCRADFQFISTASDMDGSFSERQERLLEGTNDANATQNITHSKGSSDANYLCGEYDRSCEVVAGIPNGPDLWMSSVATYERDGTYTYKEFGFFNHSSCVRSDPWLVMTYSGTWQSDSLSPYIKDRSLVSIDVTSVWLNIMHEEVCVPNAYDRSLNICLNTLAAIQVLCPCNGWPWTIAKGKESRERNVGMFCRPLEQCPLIHESFLQKTQYVSYSASREQGCFTQASPDAVTGWEHPMQETTPCLAKKEPMACTVTKAAACRGVDGTWCHWLALCSIMVASYLS